MFEIEERLRLIREGASVDIKSTDEEDIDTDLQEAVHDLYMFEADVLVEDSTLTESDLQESSIIELLMEAANGDDPEAQKKALNEIKARIGSMVKSGQFNHGKALRELKMVNLMAKRVKLQWVMGILLNPILSIPLIILSMSTKYRSIDSKTASQYVTESEEILKYLREIKGKATDIKTEKRIDRAIARLEKKIDVFKSRIMTWGKG